MGWFSDQVKLGRATIVARVAAESVFRKCRLEFKLVPREPKPRFLLGVLTARLNELLKQSNSSKFGKGGTFSRAVKPSRLWTRFSARG
jgi:hypothetical protein